MTAFWMLLAACCWIGLFGYLAFTMVSMLNPELPTPKAFAWQMGIMFLFAVGGEVFTGLGRWCLPDDGLRLTITWQPGKEPVVPPIPPAAE